MAKPRLFVESDIAINKPLELSKEAHHYLSRVMRLKVNDYCIVFNGNGPSFEARIDRIDRRFTYIVPVAIEREALLPQAIELVFAPIKKSRTDFIIEKAVELGCDRVQPVITEFTNTERVNVSRMRRHVIEATEQCGGNVIPELLLPLKFEEFVQKTSRSLVFCDEMAVVGEGLDGMRNFTLPISLLIGPEGGFSEKERIILLQAGAYRLSLGPRILRADTAVVSAISLVQSVLGDWR